MKTVTAQQAREKIQRYCAYQERSHQEVRAKLFSLGMRRSDVDEILTDLITQGYLNEERFARAFAGGKFRMKKWGRIKIVQALEAKGVSPNCVRAALQEIGEPDYLSTLKKVLHDKLSSLPEPDKFLLRNRLAKYAIQKGYEPDIVWSEVRVIVPD